MTDREKSMLIIGYSRLEIDIQNQCKRLELITDERLRAHMESIIEACKFTQKKIIEMVGEENE